MWYVITQLAVYTTYIPLIYCQLGHYMLPTTYKGNQETPLTEWWIFQSAMLVSRHVINQNVHLQGGPCRKPVIFVGWNLFHYRGETTPVTQYHGHPSIKQKHTKTQGSWLHPDASPGWPTSTKSLWRFWSHVSNTMSAGFRRNWFFEPMGN